MVEGKVILFLSFFHMEKQRAEKRREKEGEGGVCQKIIQSIYGRVKVRQEFTESFTPAL